MRFTCTSDRLPTRLAQSNIQKKNPNTIGKTSESDETNKKEAIMIRANM